MKAIDFATHLMRACLNNPTSLLENAVLFAIAAGLQHRLDIALELNYDLRVVAKCLNRLVKKGYLLAYQQPEDAADPDTQYKLSSDAKTYISHILGFYTPHNQTSSPNNSANRRI